MVNSEVSALGKHDQQKRRPMEQVIVAVFWSLSAMSYYYYYYYNYYNHHHKRHLFIKRRIQATQHIGYS